ncbi:MAG: hypothetical protein ACI4YA_02695 [Candidatus Spyradenecus sp.]
MRRYWLAFMGLEVLFLAVLGLFLWSGMPFWALMALGVVAVASLAIGCVLLLVKRQEASK